AIAVKTLAQLIRDHKTEVGQFLRAALVIATHNDGLGFHQAMVAECSRASEGLCIRGGLDCAWGATDYKEQDEARQDRRPLETDIKGALGRTDICEKIRNRWKEEFIFYADLAQLPKAPSVVVREGKADQPSLHRPNVKVEQHVARPG